MSSRFSGLGSSSSTLRLPPQDGRPGHHHHGGHFPAVELESQFILRFPPEPAQALKEAVRIGASNIRERLSIQLEPEKSNPQLRRGRVHFDGWDMSAKLMDLPTIIESNKTIDKKTFYKTADICQILICKEGEATEDEAEEVTSPNKKSKKDPHKVDKKYLYRHGICPPLKNCRRRRFRKTLRKKFVEAPEIEKEVKRLLRVDNEAIDVKYDLVTEEELTATRSENSRFAGEESTAIDQQDLFGALSDSDDDVPERKDIDIDSEGDSAMFDTSIMSNTEDSTGNFHQPVVTQFSKDMFAPSTSKPVDVASHEVGLGGFQTESSQVGARTDAVAQKLESLRQETEELRVKKQELERNIANCDNSALLHRFRQSLQDVEDELKQKEMEVEDLSMFS